MARAYICLARNDLDDQFLQALDLVPNTSLRNFPYTPPGQTGYISHFPQNGAITLVDQGAGVWAPTTTVYGLRAYLMDNVEDTGGGNLALTAAQAGNIAAAILARVTAGSALALADINTLIVAELGGGSDLDGTLGASTGTVEAVLRVLSGEVYRIAAGAPISGAANAFLAAPAGGFVTAPNQIRTYTSGPGGRPFQAAPVIPTGAIPQDVVAGRNLGAGVTQTVAATADLTFRNIRWTIDTPDLHRSVLSGAMSALVATTFSFTNPSFTYGVGGTATAVDGTAITAAARALVVYGADGAVI